MSLRRRSVLLRVALLVLVPLVFLVGLFTAKFDTAAVQAAGTAAPYVVRQPATPRSNP